MVTTLYIVRHGQSAGNKDKVFQGSLDFDLSPLGEIHIEHAASYFKDIRIDKIYSSMLQRAYKTAKAIFIKNKSTFEQEDVIKLSALDEIFAGDIEGKGYEEISELYPEAHDTLFNKPYDFSPPNGETMMELYKRTVFCVKQIVEENKGKTILLVSHGCSIKTMLCYIYGYEMEDMIKVPWVQHGNAVKITFDDDKVTEIEEIFIQED